MGRKKNKKSFSDNLEFLFQERLEDDNAQDNFSIIEEEVEVPVSKTRASTKKKGGTKAKSSRKSFSNNLERFFKDSIEGVLDGVVDGNIADTKRQLLSKGKGKRKAVGLDLLIKRTTEAVPEAQPSTEKKTKRVTVVLDTQKLEALKRIAKEEKRRLHQIIGELVNDYLRESKTS